ncbi:hypothetical protein SADUNF_Sadunf15G0108500 [Salix dunnii]|uniref:Pectinesterase inhibitor domain-containing protein n=1 Tax=Salix dunnii TaxID=1413687 RepID=A0A835MJM3_9ROSI|nr:hypothetical protein SADUNF_Sadunf15G0108500 [Salix dunnii]
MPLLQSNEAEPSWSRQPFAVSLANGQSTKTLASKLTKLRGLKPRVKASVKDCLQIDDTVNRLRNSITELKNIGEAKGRQDSQFLISNLQTWAIKARIDGVARVTSIALALVNKFGPNLQIIAGHFYRQGAAVNEIAASASGDG